MIGILLPFMAPIVYGIPCKLSKPIVICLILLLINLGITNGLKCFIVVKHNSSTIIDVEFSIMP